MTAPSSHRWFGKLTVLTQAITDISDLKPRTLLSPYEKYFYPVRVSSVAAEEKGSTPVLRAKKVGNPMIATTILPKAFDDLPMKGGEDIDSWDFVLRNAFVLQNSPIKKALAYVFDP